MSIKATAQRIPSAEGARPWLDAAMEACVVTDPEGRIVDWNRAAATLFGWRSEEALGAEIAQLIFPEDSRDEYAAMVRQVTADDGRSGARCELRAVHRTGVGLEIELSLGVATGDGRLVAFMLDISERRQAAARQQQFEAIVASSGDAIFSGPFDGTIESWNPAAERLYGYTAQEMIGSSVTRLLPGGSFDDVKPQRQALREGRSITLDAKERRKDGSLVDVALTIAPLRDDAGEVTGVVSVVRDVSERIHTAKRLTEAHARFADAFFAASTGMALVAPEGRFLEVNPALCAFLGRDEQTLLSSSFQDVTHPADLADSLAQVRRVMVGEINSFRQSKRYLLPDGGIVWGLVTLTVARDADGTTHHFVIQIQDITDRKTAEGELRRYAAQLEALAERDPLTGLLNGRAFHGALEDELRVVHAGGMSCSVIVLDVTGGEEAVTRVADAVASKRRDDDQIAHLGHGRIVILLPKVIGTQTATIARRIRSGLQSDAMVQTGWASARPADTAQSLLRRASASLTADPGPPDGQTLSQAPPAIERLLELARRQLGMPIAFLARHDGDSYIFDRVSHGDDQLRVAEGDTMSLSATHCQRMLDGRIGSTVTDLLAEPETRELEATSRWGLRAYAGVPVRLRSGEIYGTLCTVDTTPHPELAERHAELLRFLSQLAGDLIDAEAEQRAALRHTATASGVRTLLVALEARDLYTGEHSKDVVTLASAVAKRLGLDHDTTRDVEQVALLHDIGKVGIPDAILQKQGPLDKQEWQLMRQHPIVGEHIIAGTPGLSHLAPAMRAEHERWDGTGYPDGLAGRRIPLASRITLACDAFNAMTTNRPYRPAMTVTQARAELQTNAGTQFDPQVVDALLAEIDSQPAQSPSRQRDDVPSPALASAAGLTATDRTSASG